LTEQTDVLIVGAGVAGALMAWSLADAGARVTIVEAGPHVDRGVAVQRLERAPVRVPEAPYEMAPYAESPATIKDTYIRQDGPDPFRSTYLRLVGGTTWHWLGTALRLLPSDLELQSRYGVGADWPLNYADLATWYDAAEPELGVSGHTDDTFGPPKAISNAGLACRTRRSAGRADCGHVRVQGPGIAAGSKLAAFRRAAGLLRQFVMHPDLSGASQVRCDRTFAEGRGCRRSHPF
jgi:choline dehydrogenase-like flavoprotein